MANTKINTCQKGKKKPVVQNTDPPLSLSQTDSSEHYTSNDNFNSNDETNTPTPSPRKAQKVLKTKKRQFSEEADIPPDIQSLWPDAL